jgi:hypothetical protein
MEQGAPAGRTYYQSAAPARQAPLARPVTSAQATVRAVEAKREAVVRPGAPQPAASASPVMQAVPHERLKEVFLDEIRKVKKFFHGAVVAMAQKIELETDRFVFTFGPHHRALRAQLDQNRPFLEDLASKLAGRRIAVVSVEGAPAPPPDAAKDDALSQRQEELKQQALQDSGVQAMLDVFAAEIKDVQER